MKNNLPLLLWAIIEKSPSHVILLSVLQEEQSPEMTSSLFCLIFVFASFKATHIVQSSPLLDWRIAIKERLCYDCFECKAQQETEETVRYQKIVVSYLVLIPLLASCPGSTIQGRLARVFCSVGSICSERKYKKNTRLYYLI